MKAVLLAVLLMVSFTSVCIGQQFKQGDTVEIEVLIDSTGARGWRLAEVSEARIAQRSYSIKTFGGKTYVIPFLNQERWLRKPIATSIVTSSPVKVLDSTRQSSATKAITTAPAIIQPPVTYIDCKSTVDGLKQRIRDDIWKVFPDIDNVLISYVSIKENNAYKSSNTANVKSGAAIHPFAAEYYVDVIMVGKKDGAKSRKRWLYKRDYIFFENTQGSCDYTITKDEKQELPPETLPDR
jgi:hypothetical protein